MTKKTADDDPAGIRCQINSDLISFPWKMKNVNAEIENRRARRIVLWNELL